MPTRIALWLPIGLAALAAFGAAPAQARSGSPIAGKAQFSARALLGSRELWATIDVCHPTDQPNTVSIRSSMPGDGLARDRMYMSFRLQYLTATGHWLDVTKGFNPEPVLVGSGSYALDDGGTFQMVPAKPAFTLRGVVDFQWRRGRTVLLSAARLTTSGHPSRGYSDPAGYSAASCLIA